jgi:hypothetical protein
MSTLPIQTSLHSRPMSRRLASLTPVFDSVSAVLLPGLVALIISAFVIGHGHLSADGVAKVFSMVGQANTIAAP